MKKIFILGFVVFSTLGIKAQAPQPVSINCWKINQVPAGYNPDPIYSFNCLYAETQNISGPDQTTFKSGKEVHLKPGFQAHGFTGSGFFRAAVEDQPFDIFVFEPTATNGEVGRFEKVEFGLRLPEPFQSDINSFVANGSSGFNPFNPNEVLVEAKFVYMGADPNQAIGLYNDFLNLKIGLGQYTYRNGFYYDEFSRNLGAPADCGAWNNDTTSFPMRIRFAPDYTGLWAMVVRVKIGPHYDVTALPVYFKCVPSPKKGPLALGHHQRQFKYWLSNETFFPFGQNLPWSSRNGDDGLPLCWAPSRYVSPKHHMRELEDLDDIALNGGNFVRKIVALWNDDPIHEDAYNYRDALSRLWETDHFFETCEKNEIYLMWCIQMHQMYSYGSPGTDDDPETWEGSVYKLQLGLNTPHEFFTDAAAKEVYKNKLRYLLARYGYSSNLAVIELAGEVDLVDQIPGSEPVYPTNSNLRTMVGNWFQEMKSFAKNDLASNKLYTVSYAQKPLIDDPGVSYQDIVTLHKYDGGRNANILGRFNLNEEIIGDGSGQFNKPHLFGEMGLAYSANDKSAKITIDGCSDIDFHTSMWATSCMGTMGGLNWWGEYHDNFHENYIGIKQFFTDIDFEAHDWHPYRWPGDDCPCLPTSGEPAISLSNEVPNSGDYSNNEDDYFEVFYQLSDQGNNNGNYHKCFGYIHNRSNYWWNLQNNITCIDNIIVATSTARPSDDDPGNVQNFTDKIIKLRDLKDATWFNIEWYSTVTGNLLFTNTEYHGTGRFNVTVPNTINTQLYKDLAFKIYPLNDEFRNYSFNPYDTTFVSGNGYSKVENQKFFDSNSYLYFEVYPNPAKNNLFIEGQNLYSVDMYDATGKLVLQRVKQSGKIEVSLEKFKAGIYLIKLQTDNVSKTVRIVHE